MSASLFRASRAAGDLLLGGAVLTIAWLLGAVIARLIPALPLPGSLWGMALLFVALQAGWIPEARVRRAASLLVRWLGLLFVPVGVGVVAHGELVARQASAIVLAIVIGSLVTLLAAGAAAAATSAAGRSVGRERRPPGASR